MIFTIEYEEDSFLEHTCTLDDIKTEIKKNNFDIDNADVMINKIEYDECPIEKLEEYEKNIKEIFNYFKEHNVNVTISLEGMSLQETLDYLRKHPNLKEYKFFTMGNRIDAISYDNLIKVDNYISNIADYVKRFNLSPFEQTLFLSDLIRELEYKKKGKGSVSRDLIRIIEEDYIVCAGFSNILSAVLDKLGIDNEIMVYRGIPSKKIAGHEDVLIHVKDDKYNINDSYVYDLTWRARNENNENLENYDYIAIPLELDIKAKKLMYDYHNPAVRLDIKRSLLHRVKGLERLLELEAPKVIIENQLRMLFFTLHSFSNYYGLESYEDFLIREGKDLKKMDDFENLELVNKYCDEYFEKIDKEITEEQFAEALYNVKRIEVSIDKEKYRHAFDKLPGILYDRFIFMDILKEAKSKREIISEDERFMKRMLDTLFDHRHDFSDYFPKTNDKNASMMDLISTLRKIGEEDTTNPVKSGRNIK